MQLPEERHGWSEQKSQNSAQQRTEHEEAGDTAFFMLRAATTTVTAAIARMSNSGKPIDFSTVPSFEKRYRKFIAAHYGSA